MNSDSLKAAILAMAAQVGTLAVGYGIVNNAQFAQWSALSMAIVNFAFLIAHSIHAVAKKPPVLPVSSFTTGSGNTLSTVTQLAASPAPVAADAVVNPLTLQMTPRPTA